MGLIENSQYFERKLITSKTGRAQQEQQPQHDQGEEVGGKEHVAKEPGRHPDHQHLLQPDADDEPGHHDLLTDHGLFAQTQIPSMCQPVQR